jgi:hypothetical protein
MEESVKGGGLRLEVAATQTSALQPSNSLPKTPEAGLSPRSWRRVITESVAPVARVHPLVATARVPGRRVRREPGVAVARRSGAGVVDQHNSRSRSRPGAGSGWRRVSLSSGRTGKAPPPTPERAVDRMKMRFRMAGGKFGGKENL